ncbi:hypothetical protein DIPPA_11692 [Diplonema papillatum]|nr:hypothetical protein DIPPA_11692 [Diplonema papillatum]
MPRRKRAPTPSSSSSEASSSSGEAQDTASRAAAITKGLLPSASKEAYEKAYDDFISATGLQNGVLPTEESILVYLDGFKDLAAKTLWSKFSMIRAVFKTRFPKRRDEYPLATAFLKRREADSEGPKKARVFTKEQVQQFIEIDCSSKPDNDAWLFEKAFLIVGYYGGLRTQENYDLAKARIADEEEFGTSFSSQKVHPETSTKST